MGITLNRSKLHHYMHHHHHRHHPHEKQSRCLLNFAITERCFRALERIGTEMRIVTGSYVPMRTCYHMCKLLLCALICAGVIFNVVGLFTGGSGPDENAANGRAMGLRREVHSGRGFRRFVDDFDDDKPDTGKLERLRRRVQISGDESGRRWQGQDKLQIFTSNLEPAADVIPHEKQDPSILEALNSKNAASPRKEPHQQRLRPNAPRQETHDFVKQLDKKRREGQAVVQIRNDKGFEIRRRDPNPAAPAHRDPASSDVKSNDVNDQVRPSRKENRQKQEDSIVQSRRQIIRSAGIRKDRENSRSKVLADSSPKEVRDEVEHDETVEEFPLAESKRQRAPRRKSQDGSPSHAIDAHHEVRPRSVHLKASEKSSQTRSNRNMRRREDEGRPAQVEQQRPSHEGRRDVKKEDPQQAQEGKVQQSFGQKAIVVSYSFDVDKIIGQSLNRNPRVFYYEDPLVLFDEMFETTGAAKGGDLLKRNVVHDALALVGDALHCRFRARSELIMKEPRFIWDISTFQTYFRTNKCGSKSDGDDDYNDAEYPMAPIAPEDDTRAKLDDAATLQCLERACSAADLVAVRSARLPFKDLEQFWSGKQRLRFAGLKILYLLRDPRAILYRGKLDENLAFYLDSAGRMFVAAQDLCSRMLADLQNIERFLGELRTAEIIKEDSDVLLVVKEEDFLKNPEKVLKTINTFLNVPHPTDRSQARAILGSLTREIQYSMNVTRNWKTGLQLQELIKIDAACRHFYKAGYYSSVTTQFPKPAGPDGEEEEEYPEGPEREFNNFL